MFERDLKRLRKRGKQLPRLFAIVELLSQGRPLEIRNRDHALTGDWHGWRECHIEPDWLLIYRVDEVSSRLILGRTGTHADLFD